MNDDAGAPKHFRRQFFWLDRGFPSPIWAKSYTETETSAPYADKLHKPASKIIEWGLFPNTITSAAERGKANLVESGSCFNLRRDICGKQTIIPRLSENKRDLRPNHLLFSNTLVIQFC